MPDYAHQQTDKYLAELEKRLQKEYQQAVKETEEKLNDYLRRFQVKDKTWQKWVDEGKKSKEDYIKWRQSQMMVGKRWQNMKDTLAKDMNNTNKIARAMINDDIKSVYALNMNFATYQIEHGLGVDTSFTLYSHDTVQRLMTKNPDMLPPPGKKVSQRIRDGKDVRWNKRTIQSVMAQGVLQGESIPKLAHRLAQAVGDRNYKAAIRNARTMTTGAQNAGRIDAHDRARELGCLIDDYWSAVHDNRTRTSHRYLDMQKRDEEGYFSNGLQYPGDPEGDPAEVYNCRCTIIGIPRGFEDGFGLFENPDIMGMSYDDWLNAKPEYQDILHQTRVSKEIRDRYIREYRGYGGKIKPAKEKPFHSDMIEKSLGKNYNDFRDKVEKSPNKFLYERHADELTSLTLKKGGGVYRNKTIVFSLEDTEGIDKYSTLAHEYGHFFDSVIGRHDMLKFEEVDKINDLLPIKAIKATPSTSDGFIKAVRADAELCKDKIADRSIRSILLSSYEQRNATSGVQDFLDGVYGTQADGLLPWGHGNSYYNRKYDNWIKRFNKQKELKAIYKEMGLDASNLTKTKQLSRIYDTTSEAWANIGSAVTCGGKELEAVKTYMPNAYAEYMRIIRGIK